MTMTKNMSMKIAQIEFPNSTISELMEKSNEIFKRNSENWNILFPQQDIVFAKFVDRMKKHCSQKERDFFLISDKLTYVWSILHIDMKIMKKEPNEYQKYDIDLNLSALIRLGLLEMLAKDLPKKIVTFLGLDLKSKNKKRVNA